MPAFVFTGTSTFLNGTSVSEFLCFGAETGDEMSKRDFFNFHMLQAFRKFLRIMIKLEPGVGAGA